MATYTEEQKLNYVFLLHYRYKGEIAPLATAMEIDRKTLKTWAQEYTATIIEETSTDTEVRDIPQLLTLRDSTLVRMRDTLMKETDYSKLARGLEILNELMKETPSGTGTESVYETITKNMLGKSK